MRCGRDAWAAAAFAALADVLGRFPTLAQSCPLVLVPGPHDLGLSDVLPRPPLPEAVLQPLQKRVSRLVLGSNPCRYEGRVRERSARSHPARTPWTLTLGFRLKTTVVLAGSPPFFVAIAVQDPFLHQGDCALSRGPGQQAAPQLHSAAIVDGAPHATGTHSHTRARMRIALLRTGC